MAEKFYFCVPHRSSNALDAGQFYDTDSFMVLCKNEHILSFNFIIERVTADCRILSENGG